MDTENLRTFIALAEHRNFTRTADMKKEYQRRNLWILSICIVISHYRRWGCL